MFYELAASTWGEEEREAILAVLDSGRFTMGSQVAAFEEAFARYHGRKYGVMVNSGSSANLVAIAALCYKRERPLQRGDEVIVPAISWATTYHPLHQYGLKLRFVDVELDTLNMDCRQLERALTPRTRAIVGVSILGNPAALDVMRDFADRHGLYFFEDNCESADAELGGRKAGAFGDMSTLQLLLLAPHPTMEGGMVLTDDEELFQLLLSLRNHGWTRGLPADTTLFKRGASEHFEAYRFILPGYNVRPLEITAAIGLIQLQKLPGMTAQRRRNLALFQAKFGGDRRFIIQRENGKSSTFAFTIILNPERSVDRERVFAALREADIGFRMITGGNFLRHDVIRYYDYTTVGEMRNADIAHDYGFFVGNHPHDLAPQIERLHAVLDGICN